MAIETMAPLEIVELPIIQMAEIFHSLLHTFARGYIPIKSYHPSKKPDEILLNHIKPYQILWIPIKFYKTYKSRYVQPCKHQKSYALDYPSFFPS